MLGRPSGAVCDNLFKNFTVTDGSTTLRRFAMEGARSVCIIWKADSGTPSISIGAYIHPKAARESTHLALGIQGVSQGGTVAAGGSYTMYPAAAAGEFITPAADLPLGCVELDVQVAGNVVNFDVKTIVMY